MRKHKVRFKEIDITKDAKAAKDCERHGCRGVPVVMIGSKWICGFDQKSIDKMLGL
jgi:glutaredoxin